MAVQQECMRALGELGLVDPVLYTSHTLGRTSTAALTTADANLSHPLTEYKLAVLQRLCMHMLGLDAAVSQCALSTVKAIMELSEGRDLRAQLQDGAMQQLLQPFTQTDDISSDASARQRPSSTAAAPEYLAAFSAELWSTHGKPYTQWVCALAATLLHECFPRSSPVSVSNQRSAHHGSQVLGTDVVLALCGDMCAACADFAAFLLPAIVFDMARTQGGSARGGGASAAVEVISTCIREHLICDKDANSQAVRLGIEVINFLRERQVHAYTSSVRARSTAKPSHRRGSSSTNAAAPSDGKRGLPYGHGLLLDDMQIAQAALRCGASSSALLYIEFGQEDHRGMATTSRKTATSRATGSVGGAHDDRRVEGLLLQVYADLMDTDSLQGVARGDTLGLESQVADVARAMAQGEDCNWHSLLPTLDLLLQGSLRPHGHTHSSTAAAGTGTCALQSSVATSLRNMGLEHVLGRYLLGTQAAAGGAAAVAVQQQHQLPPRMRELQHESAWRLHHWDSTLLRSSGGGSDQVSAAEVTCAGLVDAGAGGTTSHFNECVRHALQSLSAGHRESGAFEGALWRLRGDVLRGLLEGLQYEGANRVAPCMVQLQCALELEEAHNMFASAAATGGGVPGTIMSSSQLKPARLVQHWNKRLPHPEENFSLSEPILALREVLLRVTCAHDTGASSDSSGEGSALHLLQDHLRATSMAACKAGSQAAAAAAAHKSLELCRAMTGVAGGAQQHLLSQLSNAHVLWTSGASDRAIATAKAVLSCLPDGDGGSGQERRLLAEALLTVGDWVGASRGESSREVLDRYLRRAVTLSKDNPEQLSTAHRKLADYVSVLYEKFRRRMESAEWKAGTRVAECRKAELATWQAAMKKRGMEIKKRGEDPHKDKGVREMMNSTITIQKEMDMDQQERQAIKQAMESFLLEAVANYEETLACSTDQDLDAVFHLVSLWLSNHANEAVNKSILEFAAGRAPSYKFLPLTYQITSRIGFGTPLFRQALHAVVTKVAMDHPHHTLLQLFALARPRTERSIIAGSGGAGGKKTAAVRTSAVQATPLSHKTLAAQTILTELRSKGGSAVPDLIAVLERVTEAYVHLSMLNVKAFHERAEPIPYAAVHSRGLPSLEKCLQPLDGQPLPVLPAVLTAPPPVDPTGKYEHVVRATGFGTTFQVTASGLHRPKIVRCLGSNGVWYRQLVKGEDDIRQDAVMMQVFGAVNGFIRDNAATSKRRLHIRTYHIVPLSPNSGLLEWVEDTMPFGAYLQEKNTDKNAPPIGAHARYYPSDLRDVECRRLLHSAESFEEKRKAFARMTERFHPAFRFFFLESFTDPFTWYHRRLDYTRLVHFTYATA
eukprot:TRINITY_DN2637_c0_g1_i3.p1 TRINITY_DN2637_c0_g1~~TRINITY_DN2637_c0_g1_i3.p1  ORF type:complete len:1520 (-),score=404.55 TRINITY_DN2637_c0_g1_i3:1308-5348(-)